MAPGHRRVSALVAARKGESLATFHGARIPHPTRYTVQVGVFEHLQLEPEPLRYINHSCHPNVTFDVRQMMIRALRPIAPGDEIVYFYPSTEWDMA